MPILRPREPVIFASDLNTLAAWYQSALGFGVKQQSHDHYDYIVLENDAGIQIGFADAAAMGVRPSDRRHNAVLLQFEVPDVKAFFAGLEATGGAVMFGPSFDEAGQFWYGGFSDPEGNPMWVVDENCP